LVDLADFLCITSFRFRFLMWQTWVCAHSCTPVLATRASAYARWTHSSFTIN